MEIEFDPAKDEANKAKHRGLSLLAAAAFEFETALVVKDTRKDYGEDRFSAIGWIGDRLHVLVYTPRERVRVISLRKANAREVDLYGKATDR